nr:nucleotide-binding domain containing protein [Cellulomonas denverensis]
MAAAQGIAAPADRADHPLRDEPSAEDRGTVVVVAGSATAVTHRQIARVRAAAGTETIAVDPAALLDEAGASQVADEVATRARAWHRDGHPRVAVLAFDTVVDGRPPDPERLSRLSGLSGHQVAIRLSDQLGGLARVLADQVAPHCAGFYLTGGDVMVRSVAALGAQGITLRDFVIPQVDHGVLRGGPYDGLPVVCKGGLTGDDRTALHSVNRLFDERSRTDAHSPA